MHTLSLKSVPEFHLRNGKVYLSILAAIGIIALFFPDIAHGQAIVDLPTMEQLQAKNEGSTVRQIFSSMFGKEFVDSPLTQLGGATGLLGAIFFVFNGALFVVGTAFILYNTVMMIAVSAHKGEVLGERMSSLWIPIRLGTGIFGMAPVFMGFSLAQALMFSIALLGNNLGDMMARKAVEMNDAFHVIVPPPGLSSAQTPIMFDDEMGGNLFAMHVCLQIYNAYHNELKGNKNPLTRGAADIYEGITQGIGEISGWLGFDPVGKPRVQIAKDGSISVAGVSITCGGVKVTNYLREKESSGFRNSAVQYEEINKTAESIYDKRKAILLDLNNEMKSIAAEWTYTFLKGETPSKYPAQAIIDASNRATKKEEAEVKKELDELAKKGSDGKGGGVIAKAAKEKMTSGGWMTLGSWYSVFAESNSAIQSAALGVFFNPMPMEIETDTLPEQVALAFETLARQKKNLADSCIFNNEVNAIGECAPMQNLFISALDAAIGDTGGAKTVNPIIASKNLGDWMLTAVGSALLMDRLAQGANAAADVVGKAGVQGKIASVAIKGVTVAARYGVGFFSKGLRILLFPFMDTPLWGAMLMLCLTMGIMLGVYIPLVPFITWFTASISYFASVVEGMVAAQIWAFSHLHVDGEGMGQRTEKGYVYMLNMLLRPALMVLGFFFASAILVLLGTFFFGQIEPAVANAQGNTVTGPLIIFGLMALFMTVTLSLIQTVFNMVYEVPDRVISWFGHGMEAKMAKEMDKDVEGKVGRAALWGRSALFGK